MTIAHTVPENWTDTIRQERAYTDGWREALRGNKFLVGVKKHRQRGWCDAILKIWRGDPSRGDLDRALYAVKMLAMLDLHRGTA